MSITVEQHNQYHLRLNTTILETLREIALENPGESEEKDVDEIFEEWRQQYSHVNYLLVDLLYD